MAERAAHLLDHVFPDVPVRQWVLSLPYRLRYQLAWDHDLCRAVVAVFLRAVRGALRKEMGSPMPWEAISKATPEDLGAIYEYLHTQPPSGEMAPTDPRVKP